MDRLGNVQQHTFGRFAILMIRFFQNAHVWGLYMFFAIGPFESKTNIQTLSKFSQLANINSNKARNERIFNKKRSHIY